jgi:rhamnogalacturonan hydrolase
MKIIQALSAVAAAVALLSSCCSAQLSGSVGPTTSTASKAAKKVCNVLNYGAVADKSTDLGPALLAAWKACNSGGIGT